MGDHSADASNNILSTTFTKKQAATTTRILYFDNLRTYGSEKWCRWEARVDGKSCAAPLAGSVYTKVNDNDHYPATIVGECPNLKAGKHTITIAVTRSSGADCHTGWTPGPKVMHALIEVQEGRADFSPSAVSGAKLMAARLTKKNTGYGGDQTSAIPNRKLSFNKKQGNSLL